MSSGKEGKVGGTVVVAQMRVYKAKAGELDAFVQEWTRGVVPLRRRFGFAVSAAWTVPDEDRFVWIMALEGDRKAFEDRDAAYYASRERKDLQPDPARHLEAVDAWLVTPVPV